jgi:hypothetical protein
MLLFSLAQGLGTHHLVSYHQNWLNVDEHNRIGFMRDGVLKKEWGTLPEKAADICKYIPRRGVAWILFGKKAACYSGLFTFQVCFRRMVWTAT